MTESEDSKGGTTVAQTQTSNESYKGPTSTPSVLGGRGGSLNDSNNTRNSASITNKGYNGENKGFGYVLALKYEKL